MAAAPETAIGPTDAPMPVMALTGRVAGAVTARRVGGPGAVGRVLPGAADGRAVAGEWIADTGPRPPGSALARGDDRGQGAADGGGACHQGRRRTGPRPRRESGSR